VDKRELGLQLYSQALVERIRDGILPVAAAKDAPLLPVLNAYRPYVSTAGVDYITTRPVRPVDRSHLNCVVAQSGWEVTAAEIMDRSELVECYARNERQVGLVIPYDFMEQTHQYVPDFIVRMRADVCGGASSGAGVSDEGSGPGLNVLLEIKGFEHFEPDRVNAKNAAARKWVSAVNNLGEFGRWGFCICRDVSGLEGMLAREVAG